MTLDEIGSWRFCPACARPIMEPQFDSEDPESDRFDWRDPRCSCCQRPWTACPCTPAYTVEELQCESEKGENMLTKLYIVEAWVNGYQITVGFLTTAFNGKEALKKTQAHIDAESGDKEPYAIVKNRCRVATEKDLKTFERFPNAILN